MKNFIQWLEAMGNDDLQNELILILHHVGDIEEALRKNDTNYALAGLKDIRESVNRLSRNLTRTQVNGLHRTED